MKSDIAVQLQITSCVEFIGAVKKSIADFKLEKTARHEPISQHDTQAIATILAHFDREISKGEILRDDLKFILRNIYGKFGRFFHVFAKRMEALRTSTAFNRSALRRGDAIRPPEQVQLLKQLTQELEEKQYLLEEKNRLRLELKATTEEHINTLADNEELNQQLILERAKIETLQQQQLQLQEYYEELRDIITQADITLPAHHSYVKPTSPRCMPGDIKIHRNKPKISLTLFPTTTNLVPEGAAAPPSPVPLTPADTQTLSSLR